MSKYIREEIEDTLVNKNYKYFTDGKYDVNIIGIRNSSTHDDTTNKFDDTITVSYKDDANE